MSDVYQKWQLQPSLLDRLTDESLQDVTDRYTKKTVIKRELVNRSEGKNIAVPVLRFISDIWQHVLLQQLIVLGESSARYLRQLTMLDELLDLASSTSGSRNKSTYQARLKKLKDSVREELGDTDLLVSEIRAICEQISETVTAVVEGTDTSFTTLVEFMHTEILPEKPLYNNAQKIDNFTINARKLKELVARDMAWLLNTTSLECTQDLDSYNYTKNSVLNFGVPNLTGVVASNIDVNILQRRIKNIILNYEPRILKKTLKVEVKKRNAMSLNSLFFDIECDVWGQPTPEHLIINSEIDLETGAFNLSKGDRAS